LMSRMSLAVAVGEFVIIFLSRETHPLNLRLSLVSKKFPSVAL
jgi:hypothetical protein